MVVPGFISNKNSGLNTNAYQVDRNQYDNVGKELQGLKEDFTNNVHESSRLDQENQDINNENTELDNQLQTLKWVNAKDKPKLQYAQPGNGDELPQDSSILKEQPLNSKSNQDVEDFLSVADSMETEEDSMETDSVTTDSTETENLIDVLEEAESRFDNMLEIRNR